MCPANSSDCRLATIDFTSARAIVSVSGSSGTPARRAGELAPADVGAELPPVEPGARGLLERRADRGDGEDAAAGAREPSVDAADSADVGTALDAMSGKRDD